MTTFGYQGGGADVEEKRLDTEPKGQVAGAAHGLL